MIQQRSRQKLPSLWLVSSSLALSVCLSWYRYVDYNNRTLKREQECAGVGGVQRLPFRRLAQPLAENLVSRIPAITTRPQRLKYGTGPMSGRARRTVGGGPPRACRCAARTPSPRRRPPGWSRRRPHGRPAGGGLALTGPPGGGRY